MSEKFTYDVFVSYSRKDEAIVHPLAERLRDDGVKVWLDDWVLKPGDPISLKIQQGLEHSRVLLMCMSKAYFDSDWTKLEHHTLLFRDPTNEQRRFVPVLLEDCEPPDVIAQFLYIDWRRRNGSVYEKLLASCSIIVPDNDEISKTDSIKDEKNPIESISRHHGMVYGIFISSDGSHAISCSADYSLKLWNLKSRYVVATLIGHKAAVRCAAISSNGKSAISGSEDGTLKLWDLENQELIGTFSGHPGTIHSVVFANGDQNAISVSIDGFLKIWDIELQHEIEKWDISPKAVTSLAVARDGNTIITGSDDQSIKIWNRHGKIRDILLGSHNGSIFNIEISHDNSFFVSCSQDSTVKIWNINPLYNIATIEGHYGSVNDVKISNDSKRILSASSDGSVKVWDVVEHSLLTSLGSQAHKKQNYLASQNLKHLRAIAVSPDDGLLISGTDRGDLEFWDLTAHAAAPSPDTARYTNAKVVLVGEAGAGKSGLALRLAENDWRETGSTHGMRVTQLDLPNDPAVPAEREVWLWDFAGQPDYRLIHQLYMNETALALMVVDPQKDKPFQPLGHWEQALARAVRRDPAKLLVAARCDRGGYVVSQRDIDAYLEGRGYAGHVNTAAKLEDDAGCTELKELIAEHIPWDRLPSTSTTKLFKALKDAVIDIKETGIVLIRVVELEQRLRLGWAGEPFEERDLRTVIGLLAGQGLIQPLDFGDFVLLQPEQINNYGSAVVRAARNSKTELAELSEQDVLEAQIEFLGMERLKGEDEKILLRAMLQTFFDRSLCLRVDTPEGVKLVFPAYFKQDRDEIPEEPQIKVTYGFKGPIDDIYTTLVVRLHYSNEFGSDRLWKYAADYNAFAGGTAGLMLTKQNDTTAKIQAYFNGKISVDTEVLFIKYIHEHLKRHAEDVSRVRDYACPSCDTPLENKKAIAKRLERGFDDIICGVCEERVLLQDLIEEKFASDKLLQHVREMDERAQIGLDNESMELILVGHAFTTVGEAGHIFRPTPNSDWGIDGEIEFKNEKGEASGRRLYLQLKSGDSYLRHRRRDGAEVFHIKNPRHADYWQAHEYPVMLVIRTSDEKIRWMNVTEYLEADIDRVNQIIFDGEPFTAVNVHKMWRQLTK